MIDRAAKGKSVRDIALSLGVGNTQIEGIPAKKTSIIQSWKAGTNGEIQYLTVKKQERQPKPAHLGLVHKSEVIKLCCHQPDIS